MRWRNALLGALATVVVLTGCANEDDASSCDPDYSGACVPPYPPDLDCADIGQPVRVEGSDPHGLDRDGDGAGCEAS
jgi:hypothetical protein